MVYFQHTQQSYDKLADTYTERVANEFEHKPLDRELMQRFAQEVAGKGPVCDLGCGPGQVARYLRQCGVTDVFGLDLSPGMIAQAQQLNPDIPFRVGNMMSLDDADSSWGGIAAFHSIIHIPREQVVTALQELHRVLRPDGVMLITFHLGEQILHLDEMWGKAVTLDFIYFTRDEMLDYLGRAGFQPMDVIERPPYPDVEAQTHRAYIFARKPAETA